jgi:hypothetical protein
MIRRRKGWRVVAVLAAALFLVINLAGGVYAALLGELVHAGIHAALLLGAYGAWRVASGRGWPRGAAAGGAPPELTNRLTNLERSVEAVAIEVGRIGEGQRHVTRLFTERRAAAAANEGRRGAGAGPRRDRAARADAARRPALSRQPRVAARRAVRRGRPRAPRGARAGGPRAAPRR